ncbi:hypothetical protein MED193_07434 [Roseobacter sp. MED193]|nr:hypothetical protein MED193_07434 [Roseobacter sp. MED193]
MMAFADPTLCGAGFPFWGPRQPADGIYSGAFALADYGQRPDDDVGQFLEGSNNQGHKPD